MRLRVAEQYIERFGELAKTGNSLIVPANLTDVAGMVATALNVMSQKPAGETVKS